MILLLQASKANEIHITNPQGRGLTACVKYIDKQGLYKGIKTVCDILKKGVKRDGENCKCVLEAGAEY